MGVRRFAIVALLCISCCGPAAPNARPSTTGATPLAPATAVDLRPYFGSYATDDGDTIVIARLGWYFDLGDSAYRTIYTTSVASHFTIGERFQFPVPKFADLVFGDGTLKVIETGHTRTSRRINYRQTDVSIPAQDATLAGTITEPLSPGPHPGIVIVHGAEPGQRHFYDVWVGIYTGLGLAVATYDKRGIGASTGSYPGEYPTEAALKTYADDAEAVREFLSRWPAIDPKRVGFHGGSQGG